MYEVSKSVKRGGEWDSMFLGFDDLFNSMGLNRVTQTNHYPPTDIWTEGSKTYVQLAIAGFEKENVKVSVEDNTLKVSGVIEKATVSKDKKYHASGISKKSFDRVFALNENTEVESADIVNGLLTIVVNSKPVQKNVKNIEVK